jgi:hypothetical protein
MSASMVANLACSSGVGLSDTIDGDVFLAALGSSNAVRLGISGGASLLALTASGLTVNAPTTFADGNVNIGGLETSSIGNANLLTTNTLRVVSNAEFDSHILSVAATAPTVAVASGAGTGASASLGSGSTDTRGTITLNIKSSGGSAGNWATVTFANPYTAAPVVVFSMNAGSGVADVANLLVASTTSGFIISSTAAPSTTTLIINYVALG